MTRCQNCQLNQFMTKQGNCRRCRQPLQCEGPPEIVHEGQPEQSDQPDQPARPVRRSVDMATAIWLLRSARGLSQLAMAKRMGIARTYISKLERSTCVPSPPQVRCIAGALEVSEYCLVALATVLAAGWHSPETESRTSPTLFQRPVDLRSGNAAPARNTTSLSMLAEA